MRKNLSSELSKISCEKCLQTGTMKMLNNINSTTQISCKCSNCGHNRAYHIIKPIRDNKKKIVDFLVSISPVKSPVLSDAAPTRGPRSNLEEEPMPQAKKKYGPKDKRVVVEFGDPEYKMKENTPIAKCKTYLDVLSYKLDKNGFPEKDEAANRRFPQSEEDAAPQNKSIMPRKERLEYRNESKPFQATAKEKLDFKEIEILLDPHPKCLSCNAKKELFKTSLEEDTKIHQQAGLADASFIEPAGDGGQWCPKVRHAVPYYVCSHYCIDGRRIPQTDREFETYKDFLIEGGDSSGMVYCGYKDWLKREVTGTYPGWVEDYIEQQGGEVSKNFKPFQHKMNLDNGQRRQMPVYPDHKLPEKRMEVEKLHQYEDQRGLTFASKNAEKRIQKQSEKKN